MQSDYQESYNQLDTHWWRAGRRDIICKLIQNLPIKSPRVIDVGCGSGAILESVSTDASEVVGVDIDNKSVAQTAERGIQSVVGTADTLPVATASMDVLIASDVLEHIQDETKALKEWYRVLSPGGYGIIFVPAFELLWCSHDELNNHYRRYRKPELCEITRSVGFAIVKSSYWNLSLTPLAAPLKLADRILQSNEPQIQETPEPFNRLFTWLLKTENEFVANGTTAPVGTSVFVVVQKPAQY